MSDVDPAWPDPEPDGWTWRLVELTCPHCGAVNVLHEQRPEALETPEGVKVECSTCDRTWTLGGQPAPPKVDPVLECGACHNTYPATHTDLAADGTWTCEGCGTENRAVSAAESLSAQVAGKVGP